MTLRKLEKREDGNFVCPECGKPLRFKDGETVAVIDGQLDMENYKPRYICDDCQVYYRSVLTTDYYDVFPLDDAEPSKEANGNPEASAETLKLSVGAVFVADLRKQSIAVGTVLSSNVPSVT